ncbi:MAG: phenylalanine 4-monooxygenase [Verrucomicrobia bacterium]|nr:phenylalanine 4-monooxygenase [Cytophagales bacterium]
MQTLSQNYKDYTTADFEVWRILFERQMAQLPPLATEAYLTGIEKIGFSADKIPDFNEINPKLKAITGWQLTVVPGLIDNKPFFEFLQNKFFCSSTWLRKPEHLDYLEEPDMFHDVFGHVPLLTNQAFVDYLAALASIALKHISDEWVIERIARIYWYTVEFGLIKENGLKIYGAGILSSAGESQYSLFSEIPQRVPYNIAEIMDTPYIKERFQEKYFVIDSYEQLFHSIPAIEKRIEQSLINSR